MMGDRSYPDDYVEDAGRSDRVAATPMRLARRNAFRLGSVQVDPAARSIRGEDGACQRLEPRILQVLIALADARGEVVTRDRLMAVCWPGQVVGDDALNRAVAQLRKALRDVDGRDACIETIPKVGYRLLPELPASLTPGPASEATLSFAAPATRRGALLWAVGGATAAAAVAVGLRQRVGSGNAPDEDPQVRRAAQAIEEQDIELAIGLLRQHLATRPRDADALGWLALAYAAAVDGGSLAPLPTPADTEKMARAALALRSDQPQAVAALAVLPAHFGAWTEADARLRRALALWPEGTPLRLRRIGLLLDTGQIEQAIPPAQALVRDRPTSRHARVALATALWLAGQSGAARTVIDASLHLWPDSGRLCWLDLMLAFDMRDQHRVEAIVADERLLTNSFPPSIVALWPQLARCMADDDPTARDQAVVAALAAPRQYASAALPALFALNWLGAVDAAFRLARGLYLGEGDIVRRPGEFRPQLFDPDRLRDTSPLFGTSARAMRREPRFEALMNDIGLTRYWRSAAIVPDYQRRHRR